MSSTGVIVLVHGSRGEHGLLQVPEVLNRITGGLKFLLSPNVKIVGASLQFNHPDLEEAAELLITQGVDRIIIAPYFLFLGRHLTEHLPQAINDLQRDHPDVQFTMTDNLGLHENFIELMARRITDSCPDLSPDTTSISSPEAIEKHSLEIVETLLPEYLTGDERVVTKRIVHASGDSFIAHLVKFSPSAISCGIDAVMNSRPIITDVRMVAAGVSSRLAKAHGCSVFCALDEAPPGQADNDNKVRTRAGVGMYSLKPKLSSSIVAIGNAPTALLALIDMIDHEQITPALVVGMPVGFVQAKESKAELMKRKVPYITIGGTRGGSAVAAATVNALLKLA